MISASVIRVLKFLVFNLLYLTELSVNYIIHNCSEEINNMMFCIHFSYSHTHHTIYLCYWEIILIDYTVYQITTSVMCWTYEP